MSSKLKPLDRSEDILRQGLAALAQIRFEADRHDDVTRLPSTQSGANRRALERVELVRSVAERLDLQPVPAAPDVNLRALTFMESVCSNIVEGMQVLPTMAIWALLEGDFDIVDVRHRAEIEDVRNLFEELRRSNRSSRGYRSWSEFRRSLLTSHGRVFSHRPGIRPGQYKDVEVRVGGRLTVPPNQVEATLRAGWDIAQATEAGFARSRVIEFLVVEVHPFRDGNGRISRLLANREISASGQQRIVLPPNWMPQYIAGLKAIQQDGDVRPWLKVCHRAQRTSATVPWTSAAVACDDMRARRMFADLPKMTPEKAKAWREELQQCGRPADLH